jgi:hypothetical protein
VRAATDGGKPKADVTSSIVDMRRVISADIATARLQSSMKRAVAYVVKRKPSNVMILMNHFSSAVPGITEVPIPVQTPTAVSIATW